MEETQTRWIDEPSALKKLAERCRAESRMALDTEADSLHSYFHKTCLIQVSTGNLTAVIDPLALGREGLLPLLEVVADPAVTVLMHGSDYDMRVLDRDFGARVRGLVDTQEMALLLGEQKTGLASLLEQEFGIHLEKKYQRADWGKRPLSREMVAYAAADTMYLDSLALRLRGRLEELGRWEWAREEFLRLEGIRYCEKEPDPCVFERIKGATALKGAARDRLYSLYRWRDGKAQQRDVPPFKILGNRALTALAATVEEMTMSRLVEMPEVGPRLARRWGRELLEVLRKPERAPVCRRRGREGDLPPSRRAVLKLMMAARDEVAATLGIQAGLLCSRALAQSIAVVDPFPSTLEELEAAGLKGWRLRVLGEVFAGLQRPGQRRNGS